MHSILLQLYHARMLHAEKHCKCSWHIASCDIEVSHQVDAVVYFYSRYQLDKFGIYLCSGVW